MISNRLPASVRNIIANAGWLAFGHGVMMGLGGVITIWVARYLGTVEMGKLQFALSFGGLLVPLALLASNEIMTRELVKRPNETQSIMGSGLLVRGLASGAALIFTLVLATWVLALETQTIWQVSIAAMAMLPWTLRIIEFWFHARLESRYVVMATLGSVGFASVARITVILCGGGVWWFLVVFLAASVALVVLEVWVYQSRGQRILEWKYDPTQAREMMHDSWPFMVIGLAVMTYLRIDQVMLGWIVGDAAVGLYAAAVVMSETFWIVPLAVGQSVLPAIVMMRQTDRRYCQYRMGQLYAGMTWLGITLAIVLTFTAEPLIKLAFGEAYSGGTKAAVILGWASIFYFQSAVLMVWVIAENKQLGYAIAAGVAALINLGMNAWLIPRFGVEGAAWATLASYAAVVWIPILAVPSLRDQRFLILGAWLNPRRWWM